MRRSDGPTRRTDKATYRVACPQLKMLSFWAAAPEEPMTHDSTQGNFPFLHFPRYWAGTVIQRTLTLTPGGRNPISMKMLKQIV